jgi:hypothetical protein
MRKNMMMPRVLLSLLPNTPTQKQQELLAGLWEQVFWEPVIDHFVCGRQITDSAGWGETPF